MVRINALGDWIMRPAGGALTLARGVERGARAAVSDGLERAALAVLDGTLDSRVAVEAGRRIASSRFTEQAVMAALTGPLVTALDSDVAAETANRVVSSRFTEQVVTAALSGPLVDGAAEDAVRFAVLQRMSKKILASDVVDEVVERLLDTPELWNFVDRIVTSPPVTEVLRRQTVSLAVELRGEMRTQVKQRGGARFERMTRRAWRGNEPSEPAERDEDTPDR